MYEDFSVKNEQFRVFVRIFVRTIIKKHQIYGNKPKNLICRN